MKQILIYNSRTKNEPLFSEVIESLRQQKLLFTIFSNNSDGRKNGTPLLPTSKSLILFLLPLWYVLYFIIFSFRSFLLKTRTVMCLHWPEKLILSPIARFFKWRVVWIELPDAILPPQFFLIKILYQWSSQNAEMIIFSHQQQEFWQETLPKLKSLHLVKPLTYPQAPFHQQDLFKALADRPRHRFVIGAIVDNLDKNLIERLLSALAIGLSVCSTLELMIIGDGENRKQLLWLVRKMGLGNHVWLVGSSTDFIRWLEHVDMYILPHENPSLEEIAKTILVMGQGIPVLGHHSAGLDEVINSRTGALIDITDSETIARQIIHLEQAGDLRKSIGKEAKKTAQYLTFEQCMVDFSSILSGPENTN